MAQVSKKHRNGQRPVYTRAGGYLVVVVIVMTSVLGAIGLSVAQTVSVKYAKTKRDIAASSATYVAEAGLSDTITKLNANSNFTGYTAKKTYYSSPTKGKADYTTAVSGSGASRKVVATGNVYRTPESTTPLVTRKLQVTLAEKSGAGPSNPATTPYAAYAGTAGATVANNSRLFGKVASQGDVYVKGKLTVTNNSHVPLYPFPLYSSGPSNIYVNNMGCLSGTEYPVACPSSEQPISLSADSSVNGVVCAPDQTTTTYISQPGLQSACTMPVMTDATFDKAAYTATMTAGSKASSLTASRCSATVDEITWTDKTTYTGNLDTSTRDCDIKLLGNTYIKGNLNLGENTKIILPYALRNTPLTIVVDGTVTLSGTEFYYESSASGAVTVNGALVRIISFASSDSSCRTSNTCNARLTSTARKAYETTADVRCINQCEISKSLLWSYHGTVLVESNSQAGMINGQGIIVRNNSSAGYLWMPNSTPNPAFGAGGTMPYSDFTTDILGTSPGWRVTDYRQIYD